MQLELNDDERRVLQHALKVYLSDLREEIVKTEKHEWRVGLHAEKDLLQRLVERLE
jgi:hypothetical protein